MGGQRVSVWMDEETVDVIDEFCRKYSLSRSEVMSDIVSGWIEDGDDAEALRAAVDETLIKAARREAEYKKMRKAQKMRERRHNWHDRIKGFISERVEGNAAYDVDGIRDLAKGYRRDAEIYSESEQEIREKHEQLEQWIEIYDLAVWCRKYGEETDTELQTGDVSGWFEVAEDLYTIRERIEEVTDHIKRVANSEGVGWDSEAVIDSVSKQWSVCRGSVILLLEQLVSDDGDSIRDMLRMGGDRIRDLDLDPALLGPSDPAEQLPDGAEINDQFVDALDQPDLPELPGRGFNPEPEQDGIEIEDDTAEWIRETEAATDGGSE